MGAFSIWHLAIVLVVILVLFGAGKIPSVMSDLGKGLKDMKKSLTEVEETKEHLVSTVHDVTSTVNKTLTN